MVFLNVVDLAVKLVTEFIYMMACCLYKAWQYRWLIITLIFFATIFFTGIITYGNLTN